ncbi:hypothetical protein [Haladaptatus cibarius]|uniref:hypothetical protein n=1 Tax=Haladaptatus cibarius TaxID=453847 RepID=UPI000679CCD5|nr:hypothetical protein [Haladaptatus cibarius]
MKSTQLFAVFVAVTLIFTGGATAMDAPITNDVDATSVSSPITYSNSVSPMMDVPCPAADEPISGGGGGDDGGC